MMSASMQGAMAFQKGLGCVHSLSHSLGGVNPRLHHGTLNAMFLPAVVRFNARAASIQAEQRLQRMAHAMGLPAATPGHRSGRGHRAMNARLGLPSGLRAMGVTEDLFERVIDGAMADHCHKTNPRIATRDDYLQMLAASLRDAGFGLCSSVAARVTCLLRFASAPCWQGEPLWCLPQPVGVATATWVPQFSRPPGTPTTADLPAAGRPTCRRRPAAGRPTSRAEGEGAAMPSVRALAGRYLLNPLTVNRALQALGDEGLLENRRGLGLYVRRRTPAPAGRRAQRFLSRRMAPAARTLAPAGHHRRTTPLGGAGGANHPMTCSRPLVQARNLSLRYGGRRLWTTSALSSPRAVWWACWATTAPARPR
jgi:hypothetical protein